MHRTTIIIKFILLFGPLLLPLPLSAVTLSGPIVASSVTVSGSVTFSSMTVSTITISNLFNVTASSLKIPGRTVQVQYSSTTAQFFVTTTTFKAVDNVLKSITLVNPNDYVRISLTGNLFSTDGAAPGYLTIFRDLVNLGDTNLGLSAASGDSADTMEVSNPVGLRLIDKPGDTSPHTYQAYIRSPNNNLVYFPIFSSAYLILEEITQ